jgi:hypothetical protein
MPRGVLAFLVACLASTASAKECETDIQCFYLDPASPKNAHNKTTGEGGPGTPGYNAPGTYDDEKARCREGKCSDLDCLYGRVAAEACPNYCGTHNILCQCVSQDTARENNEAKKKVIIGVGWTFFVFMIIVPLLGWQFARCLGRQREQNAQQQQAQLQMAQMAAPQSLSVTVPAGMGPGQALQVANPSAGGALIQVTIPAGVQAGMSFLVTPPPTPVVQPTAPMTPAPSFATASAPSAQMLVVPTRKLDAAASQPGLVGASAPTMPVAQPLQMAQPMAQPMQPTQPVRVGYQHQRACCCCAPSASCEKFWLVSTSASVSSFVFDTFDATCSHSSLRCSLPVWHLRPDCHRLPCGRIQL